MQMTIFSHTDGFIRSDQGKIVIVIETPAHSSQKSPAVKSVFICPKPGCNIEIDRQHIFDRHLKSHLDCDYCGQSFSGKNAKRAYSNHLNSHTTVPENRDYVCQICKKSYKTKAHLDRHIKSSWKSIEQLQ